MAGAASPLRDPDRLAALDATGLLDSVSEPAFDRLAALAAHCARAPMALVTLVEPTRQFFLGACGVPSSLVPGRDIPIASSLCRHEVETGMSWASEDLRADPAWRDHAAVRELGIAAYAGIPLRSDAGHVLGSVCAMDFVPRPWAPDALDALAALAALAASELRLRRQLAERDEIESARRATEAQMAAVQRVGRIGAWTLDLTTDAVWWSTEVYRIFARAPSDGPLTRDAFFAALHPDDRERVRAALDEYFASGQSYEIDYRVPQPDGTVCVVRERAEVRRHRDGTPREVIGTAQDVTASALVEDALRERERHFRALVEHTSELTTVVDAQGSVTYRSPAYLRLLGYTEEELDGMSAFDLVHPDDLPGVRALFAELIRDPGGVRSAEFRVRHRQGSWRTMSAVGHALLHDPAVAGVVITSRDVTERRTLEAQLRQAQRMEAVGQLAGGVAHDFNNLIQVILSHTEFALESLPPDSEVRQDIEAVANAGERAARLTRQLLAFGRRQFLQPRVLDPNAVVERIAPMLRRLIGEDIAIVTRLDATIGAVTADPAQLEQVLINLAINARDAMPEGGRLTIATGEVVHAHAGDAAPGADLPAPGAYVRLTVRDTGTGMDEATRARAFEPFFTTKPLGKGTGLGLATVYGIVRQSGGWVRLTSAPGQGTTVEVDLPRTEAADDEAGPASRPDRLAGAGTVLLVEDEPAVRAAVRRVLTRYGYTVREAATADEALALVAVPDGDDGADGIALVLTDLVMPGMNGRALAERLQGMRPGLPVVFMSGYSGDEIVRRGLAVAGAPVVEKPFSPDALLDAVRSALAS